MKLRNVRDKQLLHLFVNFKIYTNNISRKRSKVHNAKFIEYCISIRNKKFRTS